MKNLVALRYIFILQLCNGFVSQSFVRPQTSLKERVISPFESTPDNAKPTAEEIEKLKEFIGEPTLELTYENVEKVLDEMRDYLRQDGGDVAIQEIDGPVVKLELQGACGTCPSSTITMKMGLERRLRERIPEIQEVIQAMPEGPPLDLEQVDVILDGVRPFLQVAGGSIECTGITGEGGLQPTIHLKMEGNASSLNSVKLEIVQRIQRHFMTSGLRIEWFDDNPDNEAAFFGNMSSRRRNRR